MKRRRSSSPRPGPCVTVSGRGEMARHPSGTYAKRRRAMCTFKISITALLTGLLCLTSAPLSAQEPTVTTLMTKELTDIPGKEVVLLMVEYAPGGADAIHRHNAHGFVYVLEGSVVEDRKSTRLNSSHGYISYAVFCLKKKKNDNRSQMCCMLLSCSGD